MDEKEFDYLNVIPLVDVMLVLLTIVLTTSTFIATGGIKMELPKASAVLQVTDLRPMTIVIDKEGRIWLETGEIALASLAVALEGLDRETPIVVRADKGLPLQGFVDVFAVIKQCGFGHLSLQAEQQP